MSRYWIGVASADHVAFGVAGGFMQLNHGKAAPLRRVSAGDWIIYYAPQQTLGCLKQRQQPPQYLFTRRRPLL